MYLTRRRPIRERLARLFPVRWVWTRMSRNANRSLECRVTQREKRTDDRERSDYVAWQRQPPQLHLHLLRLKINSWIVYLWRYLIPYNILKSNGWKHSNKCNTIVIRHAAAATCKFQVMTSQKTNNNRQKLATFSTSLAELLQSCYRFIWMFVAASK